MPGDRERIKLVFNDRAYLFYVAKKLFDFVEWDHVRTVAHCNVGIGMDLHEKAVDTSRRRRARKSSGVFTLAAGTSSLAARQLKAVGHVENNWIAEGAHYRERPEVDDEIVIAECRAALGQHQFFVSRGGKLADNILHVPRRQKLALLHADRLAGIRCSDEKVRLPAKKGWYLDNIENFCGGPYLLDGMDVGNYRYSDLALDFCKQSQPLLNARSPERGNGCSVCLVEGTLEYKREAHRQADLLEPLGGMKDYLLILDHAGAGNNQWGIIAADRDISYGNFFQENLALFLHPCPGVRT